MSRINRGEIVRGVFIGSGVFLCSSILIITLYLLYRYRRQSFYFRQNLNEEHTTNIREMKQDENINNQRRSNSTGPASTIIEDLMRKSLKLAETAEKVADEKEKRISIKDRINIDLQS